MDALRQVGLKLAQCFLIRRFSKREKFTSTTTTVNGLILIRKAHALERSLTFSSGKLNVKEKSKYKKHRRINNIP